jgi:hypothetical protein
MNTSPFCSEMERAPLIRDVSIDQVKRDINSFFGLSLPLKLSRWRQLSFYCLIAVCYRVPPRLTIHASTIHQCEKVRQIKLSPFEMIIESLRIAVPSRDTMSSHLSIHCPRPVLDSA